MNTILIPFFILVSLGAIWRFLKGVPTPQTVRKVISSLVINILLPLLTLNVIAHAPVDHVLWKIPLIGIVVTLGCLLASLLLYGFISRVKPDLISSKAMGSIVIGTAWCNATYLGLPIVTGIVGIEYTFVPLLYDLLALTPLLWIVGVSVADYYAEEKTLQDSRLKHALKTIAGLPPLYAVIIGLIIRFSGLVMPEILIKTCELAGRAVPPIMMLSVGMALTMPTVKSIAILLPAAIIRLLVGPMIAGWLIMILQIDGPLSTALLLEAGMPTMVLTLAIADKYGLDTSILAQLIAISTVLSLLTLHTFM